MNMKNKIDAKVVFGGIILILILLVAVYSIINSENDEGSYDYCIEWQGLNNGTLYRDNLLFTCYNIATSTFYCDYEIDKKTNVLMIKPILNITKNDEGFITEIVYDNPNYFNCTRWLKSGEVKK